MADEPPPTAPAAPPAAASAPPASPPATPDPTPAAGAAGAPAFTSNGTWGRVIAQPPKTKAEEDEEKRKKTLAKLKEHYGKSDFYDQLAEYDPQHADWWKQMSGVQQTYHDAEGGYDAATRAYSESMRETLHQSTIDLFEDPAGLAKVNANGDSGLYDWYIGMHRTAFDQNGAWNSDFLGRGTSIARVTPGAMYGNAGRLWNGDPNDPYAKAAAEEVRKRRALQGARVSMKPGQRLPETEEELAKMREEQRLDDQFRKEHPFLWAFSKAQPM